MKQPARFPNEPNQLPSLLLCPCFLPGRQRSHVTSLTCNQHSFGAHVCVFVCMHMSMCVCASHIPGFSHRPVSRNREMSRRFYHMNDINVGSWRGGVQSILGTFPVVFVYVALDKV